MKYFAALLLLCLFPSAVVSAYAVTVTEVERPYKNVDIGVYSGQDDVFLGEIAQYPVMYQFTVTEERPFSMRVRQPYQSGSDPVPFSLLLVGVENDGASVYEVGRVRTGTEEWEIVQDQELGMTFLESAVFATNLATGTYRVEVSTPTNAGRYALMLGSSESDVGYFATVGNIRTTQNYFGYSVFRLLASPYVFYPLGILFLLFALQKTWKYRTLIRNVG